MDSTLVKEISKIIREDMNDIFEIETYINGDSSYIWLYRNDGQMVGIIHGGMDKPYELKIINIGGYRQKDINFGNWLDFRNFIINDMRGYILALAL